jgi:hypothetical protein
LAARIQTGILSSFTSFFLGSESEASRVISLKLLEEKSIVVGIYLFIYFCGENSPFFYFFLKSPKQHAQGNFLAFFFFKWSHFEGKKKL